MDVETVLKEKAKAESEYVSSQLAALAHKHAHVSYLLVGVLVLVLGLMGAGGYLAVKSFDAAEARAEQRYEKGEADRAILEKRLEATQQLIITLSQQQAQHTQAVVKRNKTADDDIKTYTEPSRDEKDVRLDVAKVYGLEEPYPYIYLKDDPHTFIFTKANVQEFVATRIDRDRLRENLKDVQTNLALEQQKTAALTVSLTDAETQAVEDKKTIAEFRKVVHKGKFARFFGGVKTGAVFTAGFVSGLVVGRLSK
jgi:hypothetical protein